MPPERSRSYYKNSNIPAELIEQYTVLELVYSGSYWYVVGNMNILTKGDSISVECFTAYYTVDIHGTGGAVLYPGIDTDCRLQFCQDRISN